MDSGVVEQVPYYSLHHLDDGTEEKLQLRVQLPGVESANELDVHITRERVTIRAPGRYRLDLPLARPVEDKPLLLRFVKKKAVLKAELRIEVAQHAAPGAAMATPPPAANGQAQPAALPKAAPVPQLHDSFMEEARKLRDKQPLGGAKLIVTPAAIASRFYATGHASEAGSRRQVDEGLRAGPVPAAVQAAAGGPLPTASVKGPEAPPTPACNGGVVRDACFGQPGAQGGRGSADEAAAPLKAAGEGGGLRRGFLGAPLVPPAPAPSAPAAACSSPAAAPLGGAAPVGLGPEGLRPVPGRTASTSAVSQPQGHDASTDSASAHHAPVADDGWSCPACEGDEASEQSETEQTLQFPRWRELGGDKTWEEEDMDMPLDEDVYEFMLWECKAASAVREQDYEQAAWALRHAALLFPNAVDQALMAEVERRKQAADRARRESAAQAAGRASGNAQELYEECGVGAQEDGAATGTRSYSTSYSYVRPENSGRREAPRGGGAGAKGPEGGAGSSGGASTNGGEGSNSSSYAHSFHSSSSSADAAHHPPRGAGSSNGPSADAGAGSYSSSYAHSFHRSRGSADATDPPPRGAGARTGRPPPAAGVSPPKAGGGPQGASSRPNGGAGASPQGAKSRPSGGADGGPQGAKSQPGGGVGGGGGSARAALARWRSWAVLAWALLRFAAVWVFEAVWTGAPFLLAKAAYRRGYCSPLLWLFSEDPRKGQALQCAVLAVQVGCVGLLWLFRATVADLWCMLVWRPPFYVAFILVALAMYWRDASRILNTFWYLPMTWWALGGGWSALLGLAATFAAVFASRGHWEASFLAVLAADRACWHLPMPWAAVATAAAAILWYFHCFVGSPAGDGDGDADSGGAPAGVNMRRQGVPKGASGEIRRILEAATHYEVLEAPRSATDDELRRAKKLKALATHPDKNQGAPGASQAFMRVTDAYEVLADASLRRAYDSMLAAAERDAATAKRAAEARARGAARGADAGNGLPPMHLMCSACGGEHVAPATDISPSAARSCDVCGVKHAAYEGDGWVESTGWFGRRHVYMCFSGVVYDASEWAECNGVLHERNGYPVANAHQPEWHFPRQGSGGGRGGGGRGGGGSSVGRQFKKCGKKGRKGKR